MPAKLSFLALKQTMRLYFVTMNCKTGAVSSLLSAYMQSQHYLQLLECYLILELLVNTY